MSMPQGQRQQGQGQQGRAPVVECVREGFAFLARDWRLIAPVALIGAAVMTPIEMWSETSLRAGDMGQAGLATIAGALVQAPVLSAYYRRAVSRGTAPLTLRLGADERNLAGVTLSISFVMMIVAVVGFVIAMFATAALLVGAGVDPNALQNLPPQEALQRTVAALGTDGSIALTVILVAFVAVLLWFTARLALSYAATVAEGKMMIFSTWAWTKGNASSIVACLLLTVLLPSLVLSVLIGDAASHTPGSAVHWIVTFITAAAALFFVQAPYAALTAYLYRGLRPQ